MPADTAVWHGNYKINTDERGFNFGFYQVGSDEVTIRDRFNDVGARIKKLLPKTADIFYASYSQKTKERDGRFLHLSVGQGEFVEEVGPPEKSDYDFSRTCVNIRLETLAGKQAHMKFAPLPDKLVYGGFLLDTIDPILAMPGVIPAAGDGADWYIEFSSFMAALVKYAVHIPVNWVPGGLVDESSTYLRAFATRVSAKKGGRVFI